MKTKLTLTVNEAVLQKAKKHVGKSSQSLSSAVEVFLKNMISKNEKYSAVDASRGLLKGKFKSMSDKEIRTLYHKEKHGI